MPITNEPGYHQNWAPPPPPPAPSGASTYGGGPRPGPMPPPPPPAYSPPRYIGAPASSAPPSYSIAGGGGAPSIGTPAAATVNPNDTPYWWMMSIPEVSTVINQAVSGGHDADWIKAHIERTGWWQQNSESTRNWLQLQAQDPATAHQQWVQKAGDIMFRSQALGLGMTWDYALGLAQQAITMNWNEGQVNDALGHTIWAQGNTTGILQATKEKVNAIAHQYGVPASDQQLVFLTDAAVFQANGDTSGAQAYFANAAKSLYPAAAAAINNGQTLQQFFDPYRQVAAKDLEISPDAVDLTDPKWNKAINSVDPKTNNKYAMSLGDFETEIKTNPIYGYDSTRGARQEASNLAVSMLQSFGRQ